MEKKHELGDGYGDRGALVMNFADAIRDEDAIIEGYNKGIESYVGVKFRGSKRKEYYLTPLSGDFSIFNKIVKVANGSFTVDAVADDKKQMVAGNPLIFKKGKNRKFSFRKNKVFEEYSEDVLDMIEDRLSNLGEVGNIQDMGEGVIEDLIKTGNCFIQIRRVMSEEGKWDLYFSIIPVQNCRLKMRAWLDENGKSYRIDTSVAIAVGVCSNWDSANKIMNVGEIFDIPILGAGDVSEDWVSVKVGEVEYEMTCIHLKYRKTGFKHYGMPRWIPAYWYAVFEHVFGRVNVTKVKNNSMASGVLQLFANPSITKVRSEELKKEIQDKYNTMDGVGSIMVQVLTDKDLAANWISFDGGKSKEGDYIALLTMCSKVLITTMRTFPDLAGIAVAGELGGTDKVKSNFIITQNRDIYPHQNLIIEKVYLPVFKMIHQLEKNEDFNELNCEYSNSVPTLLFGNINLENILDRDELRSELGYPAQMKEYAAQNPINPPVNQ